MSLVLIAAMASALPQVPESYVQLIQQGSKHYVRNLIDDSPVYTFDGDEPGRSNCNDACAETWTPLRAASDARSVGQWSLILRADGSQQWAFAGKPVYSFARDPEPVALADGRQGNWHLLPALVAD